MYFSNYMEIFEEGCCHIRSVYDAEKYIRSIVPHFKKELFIVLGLDSDFISVGKPKIIGHGTRTRVKSREDYISSLIRKNPNIKYFIGAHTHPDDIHDVNPSKDDFFADISMGKYINRHGVVYLGSIILGPEQFCYSRPLGWDNNFYQEHSILDEIMIFTT